MNSPGADLLVERVEPGGLHLHEHVVLADDGLGDVRFLQRLLVLGDDERSHAMVLLLVDDLWVSLFLGYPSTLNHESTQ